MQESVLWLCVCLGEVEELRTGKHQQCSGIFSKSTLQLVFGELSN